MLLDRLTHGQTCGGANVLLKRPFLFLLWRIWGGRVAGTRGSCIEDGAQVRIWRKCRWLGSLDGWSLEISSSLFAYRMRALARILLLPIRAIFNSNDKDNVNDNRMHAVATL
jgi:hypothetical protein